ncbi:MAG: hypothetical protein EOP62_02445 [Sphingomonadales bacterium]|nr:MAG: hypothetical protein EOP62_02445 [Sphingomonadales bacterium]
MVKDVLEVVANLAAILTGIIAVLAYFHFIWGERTRRLALEHHLRQEALNSQDEGRRTAIHLMAYLSMTEAEVLRAGFQSKLVCSEPGVDDQGRANRLYFRYNSADVQRHPPF